MAMFLAQIKDFRHDAAAAAKMRPRPALLFVAIAVCLSTVKGKEPCTPNPYPVFYNVQGRGNLSDVATNYGMIGGYDTYTGGMGGVWPRVEGSKIINGGVPQATNFTLHADALRTRIAARIPKGFTGNCAFDFEQWTNVFELNTGSGSWHSKVYQDYSIELEQKAHPSWSHKKCKDAAKKAFTAAATKWMVDTLEVAKSVRPKCRWGYYGFPQNWNDCVFKTCGYNLPILGDIYRKYTDMQLPLYNASTALYPSVYVFKSLKQDQLPSYIEGTVSEARRVAPAGVPVYPFQMSQFHNLALGLLPPDMLTPAVQLPQYAGADGLVLWGAFSHANATYNKYMNTTLGPTVWNFLEELCHK